MTTRLPPLNWLRAFEAAARHSSFAAAASDVNLTPAAVSYQVRSLEQLLGFRLFERLPRGLRLTDVGRAYLPAIRRAFDDIAMSTVGLFGREEVVLTVRASASYATLVLPRRLPEFRRLYPHVSIRLFSTIWSDRPENEDADVEIRYGDGDWPGWTAERLEAHESIVVAQSPASRGQSAAEYLAECATSGVILVMGCEDLWPKLLARAGADPSLAIRTAAIADSSAMALEMAASGLGPLLVSRAFADLYLDAGRLVRPVETALPTRQGHFLLMPVEETAHRAEAMLFRDWLISGRRGEGGAIDPGEMAGPTISDR